MRRIVSFRMGLPPYQIVRGDPRADLLQQAEDKAHTLLPLLIRYLYRADFLPHRLARIEAVTVGEEECRQFQRRRAQRMGNAGDGTAVIVIGAAPGPFQPLIRLQDDTGIEIAIDMQGRPDERLFPRLSASERET